MLNSFRSKSFDCIVLMNKKYLCAIHGPERRANSRNVLSRKSIHRPKCSIAHPCFIFELSLRHAAVICPNLFFVGSQTARSHHCSQSVTTCEPRFILSLQLVNFARVLLPFAVPFLHLSNVNHSASLPERVLSTHDARLHQVCL